MSVGRKLMLLALAFVITGAIPLIANFGSCDDMPCCHPTGKVLGQAKSGDCCSPATCIKEEKVVRAHDAGQRHHLKQITVAASHLSLPAITTTSALEHLAPVSPPRTVGERLSALSILQI